MRIKYFDITGFLSEFTDSEMQKVGLLEKKEFDKLIEDIKDSIEEIIHKL